MKRLYPLAAVLALSLAACVSSEDMAQKKTLADAGNRFTFCQAGADCQEKWQRALQWVKTHSAYEVTTQSDSLIETAGPSGIFDDRMAFTVSKKRMITSSQTDSYTIALFTRCDNWFGCTPSSLKEKADFATFVIGSPPASKQSLGIKVTPVTPDMAQKMQLNGIQGLAVASIAPQSLAEKAGLSEGDIIVHYDGKPVLTEEALNTMVANTPPGHRAAIDIIRGRAPQTVFLVLPAPPAK